MLNNICNSLTPINEVLNFTYFQFQKKNRRRKQNQEYHRNPNVDSNQHSYQSQFYDGISPQFLNSNEPSLDINSK